MDWPESCSGNSAQIARTSSSTWSQGNWVPAEISRRLQVSPEDAAATDQIDDDTLDHDRHVQPKADLRRCCRRRASGPRRLVRASSATGVRRTRTKSRNLGAGY